MVPRRPVSALGDLSVDVSGVPLRPQMSEIAHLTCLGHRLYGRTGLHRPAEFGAKPEPVPKTRVHILHSGICFKAPQGLLGTVGPMFLAPCVSE